MSPTDLHVYDSLIRVLDAERVIASPAAHSPDAIGAAVEVVTGSKLDGQRAEALAKLRRSIQQKGC